MFDGYLTGLLIINVYIIGLYFLTCYINYRIVRKFDNTISFLENLIPFWNIYLIHRTALGKPFAIYYFWGSIVILVLLNEVTKIYSHDNIIQIASNIIFALITSIPLSFIAQKLGKNFWLYFLLMLIPSLTSTWLSFIISEVLILILAFDNSKPLPQPSEEVSSNTTIQ